LNTSHKTSKDIKSSSKKLLSSENIDTNKRLIMKSDTFVVLSSMLESAKCLDDELKK
jgi:hypothetical protein